MTLPIRTMVAELSPKWRLCLTSDWCVVAVVWTCSNVHLEQYPAGDTHPQGIPGHQHVYCSRNTYTTILIKGNLSLIYVTVQVQ